MNPAIKGKMNEKKEFKINSNFSSIQKYCQQYLEDRKKEIEKKVSEELGNWVMSITICK